MNAPQKFGRLTLLEHKAGRTADGHIKARWQCDCGNVVDIAYSRVKHGSPVSCGCYLREQMSKRATTHGGRNSPEYGPWMAMRRRCEDVNDKDFPRYGGSGVAVCPEWSQSFEAFRDHIGLRPSGTTIDRIDGTRGYEPGNVRWATAQVQGRNRRGTYTWHIKGQVFETITDAATAFSVSEHSVSRWVNGQFDKRRNRMTPPRPDCHVVPRYA